MIEQSIQDYFHITATRVGHLSDVYVVTAGMVVSGGTSGIMIDSQSMTHVGAEQIYA